MDQELKAYLDAKFAAADEKLDRAVRAFAGEVGSLHTEIQQSEARLGARLDSIDSRLKLQAGPIQSGARAMARFSEFSENSELRRVALVGRGEALEKEARREVVTTPTLYSETIRC
jgi:hypothetical protein